VNSAVQENDFVIHNFKFNKVQPQQALRSIIGLSMMTGDSPIQLQNAVPTSPDDYPMSEAIDNLRNGAMNRAAKTFDANDFLYLMDAVRNFNTSPRLGDISAYVMWVNAADDFINPSVGVDEPEAKRIKRGQLVILPASEQTRGHMSYRYPAIWSSYLEELLKESEK
jgi:homoserine O-acetyltransferase